MNKPFAKAKNYQIKAKLQSEKLAYYFNYYYFGKLANSDNTDNNEFYNLLNSHLNQLSNCSKVDITSITKAFDNTKFYFKTNKQLKCLDLHNKVCSLESCIGFDVLLTANIKTYDFFINETRKIGISILVNNVKILANDTC